MIGYMVNWEFGRANDKTTTLGPTAQTRNHIFGPVLKSIRSIRHHASSGQPAPHGLELTRAIKQIKKGVHGARTRPGGPGPKTKSAAESENKTTRRSFSSHGAGRPLKTLKQAQKQNQIADEQSQNTERWRGLRQTRPSASLKSHRNFEFSFWNCMATFLSWTIQTSGARARA